jgi:hypothetical protein
MVTSSGSESVALIADDDEPPKVVMEGEVHWFVFISSD